MHNIDELATRLIPHYTHFKVSERLLFTGHSHQAWPDIALQGQQEYFHASAELIDKKWDLAFEKADTLRNYLRTYYDDPEGLYCLDENTHILFVNWLSSLDLKNKPKIITTDGEFHSLYRQLHRLEEAGIEVDYIDTHPDESFLDRISASMDHRTAAIMLSRVYFETSLVNIHLSDIAKAAREKNIPVLIDDYHGTNAVPLSIREAGLDDCFFLIGGYKYLQWGEGNCFLRFPKDCAYRPAITGWFASFSTLETPRDKELTQYDNGNQRFTTATYDSSSQFRAAKVVNFFHEQGLTSTVLRSQYQAQIALLKELFLKKEFSSDLIRLSHNCPIEQNGGFLSLTSPIAKQLREDLLSRDVFTDARGHILRFGAAPYQTSSQIEQAIDELEKSVKNLG